jgi:hypothetical protein
MIISRGPAASIHAGKREDLLAVTIVAVEALLAFVSSPRIRKAGRSSVIDIVEPTRADVRKG